MSDITSTPTTVASLVSLTNSKIESKILTEDNYEVLSVEPLRLTTTQHNTVVKIRVDLAARTPNLAIPASDRFSVRTVELTRIDLKDIAAFRGIEKNTLGQYVATASVDAIISLLGANIQPEEVELIKIRDGVHLFRAKPDSLGYIGGLTIVGEADETEEGEAGAGENENNNNPQPKPQVSALTIQGPNEVEVDSVNTYTVVGTPADAELPSVTWSVDVGEISEGEYLAPAEGETATITASVTTEGGVVTGTLEVTLRPKV